MLPDFHHFFMHLVTLQKAKVSGSQISSLCPVKDHTKKNLCFSANIDTGQCKCHKGCFSGNAYTLAQHLNNDNPEQWLTNTDYKPMKTTLKNTKKVALPKEAEKDLIAVTDGIDSVVASNGPYSLTIDATSMAIEPELIPDVFALHQNYPNPFNPVTTLRYDLPEDAMVNITIYDMMGRQVSTLVSSQQTAGYKSVKWNATNNKGSPVSAGLYLYTIQAGEFRQTKKMVLLK